MRTYTIDIVHHHPFVLADAFPYVWGLAALRLCIDLFSGNAAFYKYGAAPSYVRNGNAVRRIQSDTLAAGLGAGAEALRCQYNALLRAEGQADLVVDLDALMADPDDPHRMRADLHIGDGVHPNWQGGKIMAEAVMGCCFTVLI